jgi:hypothetical protein
MVAWIRLRGNEDRHHHFTETGQMTTQYNGIKLHKVHSDTARTLEALSPTDAPGAHALSPDHGPRLEELSPTGARGAHALSPDHGPRLEELSPTGARGAPNPKH